VLTAIPDVATERAFLGTALHAPVRGQLEVLRGALIVVGSNGRISVVHRGDSPDTGRLVEGFAATKRLVTLGPDQYLLPGLVDLHVHALEASYSQR
jgi:guanine deaminase